MKLKSKELQALLDYKRAKISIGKLKNILELDIYEVRTLLFALGIYQ